MPCRRSPHGQHAEIPVTVNMISPTLVFVAALHKWINGELFVWAHCWAEPTHRWRVTLFKVHRLDRWCQIIKHVRPVSRRNLVNNTIKREGEKKKKEKLLLKKAGICFQWQVCFGGGASVRSCANVTYSMMWLSCGDAVKWRPPFLQQRLQPGLCNSSGQEADDMALCMHGGVNSMWVRSMALTSQSGYLQVVSVGVIGSSADWGGGRI